MKQKCVTTSIAGILVMGISVLGAPVVVAASAVAPAVTAGLMLAAAQTHQGTGTVKQIDKKGRKVELEHGPIESIGWMAMKMYFEVDDAELLDEVEIGDKVQFDFIETRDKRYVITDMELQ